ncbi:MAG: type III secretion protein, partial [Comamonadaceae bacterium]
RVALAALVALCAQATLGTSPGPALADPLALAVLVQQVAIGMALGFTARLVFAAVELAGELVGLQMGLNFASFFDPVSNAPMSAVSRFFGNVAMLMFVVINGHLTVLMAVIKSFEVFPIGTGTMQAFARLRLHELGAELFASALWIALPMVALLLFINLLMGIISRVAPQMNIYAIGFPITLTSGLAGMALVLPLMEQPLLQLMERMLGLFTGAR